MSAMVYFWWGWDDEQDEYFLNPCHYQIIQCVCFFCKRFFMPQCTIVFFRILCLYLFTVSTIYCANFGVSLCCYSDILPYCSA